MSTVAPARHLDVIERAAGLFDELHVLVVHNPGKTALLPIAQRVCRWWLG